MAYRIEADSITLGTFHCENWEKALALALATWPRRMDNAERISIINEKEDE